MAAASPDNQEQVGGAPSRGVALTGPVVPMRLERIASLVGMCLGAVGGTFYGAVLVQSVKGPLATWPGISLTLLIGLGLGCAAGYLLGPNLSVRPYFWAENRLATIPLLELVGATLGVIVALAIAALVALIGSGLPHGLGWVVAVVVAFVLVPLGLSVGRRRRQEISQIGLPLTSGGPSLARVVVDTSAVIDGRLLDLARAGFCLYELVVPHFVLEELQAVADSADPLRRSRGRRGLAMLEELRGLSGIDFRVVETDYPSMTEVDAKLVRLAKEERAGLLTVDYNLARLAQIDGLRVLNLNQLATALRPAIVAGERVEVQVVKEGKEPEQGVAYLEDGTMMVVEGGRDRLGERVAVTVRSVIQTASGRLVFAQIDSQSPAPDGAASAAEASGS